MMFSDSSDGKDREAGGAGLPLRDDFGMSSLELSAEVYEGLSVLLERYRSHVELDVVALLDENGMPVATSGGDDMPPGQLDAMGALATGAFGSMQALAERLGEEEFSGCFHHGKERHFHLCPVPGGLLLVSVFGNRVPSGLVSVYSGRIAEAIGGQMAAPVREGQMEQVMSGGGGEARGEARGERDARAEIEPAGVLESDVTMEPEPASETLVQEEVVEVVEVVGEVAEVAEVEVGGGEGGDVGDNLSFLQEQLREVAQARGAEEALPFLQDLEPVGEAEERVGVEEVEEKEDSVFSMAPPPLEPAMPESTEMPPEAPVEAEEALFTPTEPEAPGAGPVSPGRAMGEPPLFGQESGVRPSSSPFSIDPHPEPPAERERAAPVEPPPGFAPAESVYQSPRPRPEPPGSGAFVGANDPPDHALGPRPTFGAVAPRDDAGTGGELGGGGGDGLVLPPPPREAPEGEGQQAPPAFKSPFTVDDGVEGGEGGGS
ncbi:MAG: roadblock/LC7 domain-containing protein [Verrucomicrobiota bacterium]